MITRASPITAGILVSLLSRGHDVSYLLSSATKDKIELNDNSTPNLLAYLEN